MSPAAAFDYYEALEISRTATNEDITRSYRRLALIHHPDKNSGDPAATARFQRISEAYETLSDQNRRQRYDNPSRPSFAGYSPPDSDDYGDDFVSDYDAHNFFFNMFFGRGGRDDFEGYGREDIQEAIRAERRARAEVDESNMRAERAARRARDDEDERKREAKKVAKDAAKQQQEDEIAAMHKRELAYMEDYWRANNAHTFEEKQDACGHSSYWPSEKLRAKVKCQNCRQKRGTTAYKCPLCAKVCCKVCKDHFLNQNGPYRTVR